MRAAILARVSTEQQAADDRFSLAAQVRIMRERCEREGWEVVAEFVAPGERASTHDLSKRPVLNEILGGAASGQFDVLVHHESSRLARDEEMAQWLLNRLTEHGVMLVNATSAIDYLTPEGRAFFGFEHTLNAYWSRKMGEHMRKTARERFEKGLHLGDPPFGYRRVAPNQPYELIPEEAEAIAEAYRDYVAGASWSEIARDWNSRGLRPRSKQGHTRFTLPAMQTILQNDFYAGYVRYKGERRVGVHEPIIPEDLWLAAQTRGKRRAPRAKRVHLLSGLAMCARCSGPIWTTTAGRSTSISTYYREPSRNRGRECPDASKAVNIRLADSEVDRIVMAMTADEDWLRETERMARVQPQGDPAPERDGLQDEKRRATNAYVAGAMTEDEWRRRVAAIDDRLSRLPVPLPGGMLFTGERLRSIGQAWAAMETAERRDLCRTIFEQVQIDMRAKAVRVRPWPEFEPWFAERRELVWSLMGPAGFEPGNLRSPWLYSAHELERPA